MCEYCGVQSHQCNVTPMEYSEDAEPTAEEALKRIMLLENRIAELEGLIDEVVALDPLFPDELMDRLRGVE